MRTALLLVVVAALAAACASAPKPLRQGQRASAPPPAWVKESGGRPGPGATRPATRPPVPAANNNVSVLDPSVYRLAAGDVVRVDVFNEPELSLDADVDSSGNISYPLLGRVRAAGLTPRQLETYIADRLRGGYLVQPDVRVGIAHYRPFFVTGMVRKVGSYPYVLGLTVDKALAMAGGITEFGSEKKIYLQPENAGDNQRVKVDLDHPVYPGDTILVEERLF